MNHSSSNGATVPVHSSSTDAASPSAAEPQLSVSEASAKQLITTMKQCVEAIVVPPHECSTPLPLPPEQGETLSPNILVATVRKQAPLHCTADSYRKNKGTLTFTPRREEQLIVLLITLQ